MDGCNLEREVCVCVCVCTRWVLVIDKPEIMWRENWISPENNRMRMLMSFSAYAWGKNKYIIFLSCFPSQSLSSLSLLTSFQLFPLVFLSFYPSFPFIHANSICSVLPVSRLSFLFLSPVVFPSIFHYTHQFLPLPPSHSGCPLHVAHHF